VLKTLLTLLAGSGLTVAAAVGIILANPDKAEKWFSLFWRLVMACGLGIRVAHKKYVQHDFQGSVNEFVKKHAKAMPGFQVKGVKLQWVDAEEKRQAFLEADRVVVRVKRDDPHHENFVKAVFLFVSTSLLFRAKRYISPPQGRAIDLFVSAEIFREQKPEVVDYFLERYLHPQIDDGSAKVTSLFHRFDGISTAGLFYPVFLQEMDYLGRKVWGTIKAQDVVLEVDELVGFLESLAQRRVGDDQVDLDFIKQYCRFMVVIVGKQVKMSKSLSPYVSYIRNGIPQNVETIYLVGRAENEAAIREVCGQVSDLYDLACEKRMPKIVMYGEEKVKLNGLVAVLRAKNMRLYASADV
jgi:hypothetical protein